MKQLICEMCGSADLMKQDGVFVCQSCGCKYSVEEARKMMIEGTVDVSGSTVKVDITESIERDLLNARNALAGDEWEEAKRYFQQVKDNCPDHFEAAIYLAIVNAKSDLLLNDKDHEVRTQVFKGLSNQLSKLKTLSYGDDQPENVALLKDISKRIMDVMSTFFRAKEMRDARGQLWTTRGQTYSLLLELSEHFRAIVQEISLTKDQLFLHEILAEQYQLLLKLDYSHMTPLGLTDYINGSDKAQFALELSNQYEAIKRFNPDFVAPEVPKYEPMSNNQSGGCYVATAVYGSYDCPQVWTLRRFRDYTLAETWYGRAFIRLYYAVSPTLVKWFGHTEWFKKLWKGKLDRMVSKLNNEGVENTPYNDKIW